MLEAIKICRVFSIRKYAIRIIIIMCIVNMIVCMVKRKTVALVGDLVVEEVEMCFKLIRL